LLLDNERFAQHKREIEEKFATSLVRESTLAGKDYEADPKGLIRQLSSCFLDPEGPGKLPERPIGKESISRPLRGAVLPHIDLARGGYCYAWGYKEIAESSNADTFVILGTLHTEANAPFILTRKRFSTPLGDLEADQDLISCLLEGCSYDLFAEEIAHRAEHSLELQMVFLSYVFRDLRPVRVVPILCRSFHDLIDQGMSPWEDPRIASFVERLRKAVAERQDRVCTLASVDLAHMGPRFGDPHPLGERNWRSIAGQDRELIRHMEEIDAEGFYQEIRREKNKRNVCGVSAIYSLLATVAASEGKLLKYGQWPDPHGTVTFASLAFYD
jgi:AmmeMemoRadiSam system protein B